MESFSPIATYLILLLSKITDMPSLRSDYAIIVSSCLPHVRSKEAEKKPDLMETYKFHNFIGSRSSSCQQEPNVDYLPTFLADGTKFVRVYRLGCFLPYCRSTGRRSSFHGRKKKESRGDNRRLVQVSALNTTILFCECGEKLGQVTCPNPWSLRVSRGYSCIIALRRQIASRASVNPRHVATSPMELPKSALLWSLWVQCSRSRHSSNDQRRPVVTWENSKKKAS